MEYVQAEYGRIFVARFDDSEDLLSGLKNLIIKENVRSGVIHLMGAVSKSKLVLGPEERAYPPKPHFKHFDDAREVLALGIFAWENNEPKIHLHSAVGHHSEAIVGCIRELCEVYLVIEAVIMEFNSSNISRKLDNRYNASLLSFD